MSFASHEGERAGDTTGGDSTHGLHLKNYSLLRDLLGVAAGAVTEAGSISTYDMGGERIQSLQLARLVFVLRKWHVLLRKLNTNSLVPLNPSTPMLSFKFLDDQEHHFKIPFVTYLCYT